MTLASLFIATSLLQVPKLDADTAKLFAWFDTLGSQAYMTKPFVGVEMVGQRWQWPLRDTGFLLNEDKASFTILNLDHAVVTYRKVYRTGYYDEFKAIPLKFEEVLKNEMAFGSNFEKESAADEKTGKRRPRFIGVEESIAWWCWKFGYFAESKKLMQPHIEWVASVKKDAVGGRIEFYDFVKSVQRNVVNSIGLKALAMVEDDTYSRQDLLDKFSELAQKFGWITNGKDFIAARDTLQRMVEEDKNPPVFDDTQNGKIANLIWSFRDKYGVISRSSSSETAKELASYGLSAIPALTDALTDTSLGRGLYYGKTGPPPSFHIGRIETVGDGALSAIAKIANKEFHAGSRKELQSVIRRWYLAKLSRGDEGVWTESIRNHDEYAKDSAFRLVQTFPKKALPVITQAYKAAVSIYHREAYILSLEQLDGPEKLPFLRKVAETDEEQVVRVAALRCLLPTDREYVLERCMEEIRKSEKPEYRRTALDELATVMVRCGVASHVRFVAAAISKEPPHIRSSVLESFYNQVSPLEEILKAPGDQHTEQTIQYRYALEDLLAHDLTFRVELQPKTGQVWPNLARTSLRLLSLLFPRTYKYDAFGNENQQFDAAMSAYRESCRQRAKK